MIFDDLHVSKIADLVIVSQDLKLQIARNMVKHGGGFVKALSECVKRADTDNLRTLVFGFEEYFKEYQPGKWPKGGK